MKFTRMLPLAVVLVIAGCDGEGVTRPPPTDVKIFNAAPNVESVVFRREQDVQNASQLGFGQGETRRFDSGPYEFNLDYATVTGPVRAHSFEQTLSPQLDHIFVAISPGGQPQVLSFTTDDRPSNATPRVTIVHAFEGMGALDVYMETAGTLPGTTSPRGTIGFTDALTFEIAAGTYQVYLTTAGDPNDVVFESTNQTVDAQQNPADSEIAYVVADPAGQGTASIVVFRIGAAATSSGRLGQIGLQSSLRVVHGLTDRAARDFYLDDTTAAPLFPAQPFGELSAYADVNFGPHEAIVTPVGNPGAEEVAVDYVAFPGVFYTIMFGNTAAGDPVVQVIVEDKRSITGQATLSLLNAAGSFQAVDVYIEAPATDITNENPSATLFPPGFVPRQPLVPGDYEITIKNPFTGATLYGPAPVSLLDGGVYGLLIVDGVGGSTVDLVQFNDFTP